MSLQQIDAFNGFRFLFGTGPNNHCSSARVFGFEIGVDEFIHHLLNFLVFYQKINIITSIDEHNLSTNVSAEYIIVKKANEIGLISEPVRNDGYALQLSEFEHQTFKSFLNSPETMLTIGLDRTSYLIFIKEIHFQMDLLKDNSNYFIFHNQSIEIQDYILLSTIMKQLFQNMNFHIHIIL